MERLRCFPWALAVLIILARPACGTNVGGTLSTNATWHSSGNPYVVTTPLVVDSNATLTIQPGVSVQVYSDAGIIVYGRLNAEGTSSNEITFTRYPSHSYGGGFAFLGKENPDALSATGSLKYCRMWLLRPARYQSYTYQAVIYSTYSDLVVQDCTFTNMTAKIMLPSDSRINIARVRMNNVGEGINAVRCAGSIVSNHISNIIGYADGIDLDLKWEGSGDGFMIVSYNRVYNGSDPDADGIDLGTSLGMVCGNIVSNFADKGLSIGEGSDPPLYNNIVRNCGEGITIKDSSEPILANNLVVGCGIGVRSREKNEGEGGGRGWASNLIVWGCGVGISLEDGSTLEVGHSLIQGTSVWPGGSNILADPQFADFAAGDFHLLPGSPCVNAGVNMGWMTNIPDADGGSRILDATVDMGPFEYVRGALACNFAGDTLRGYTPLPVTFTAYVAGTNTSGLFYSWDFENDGTNNVSGYGLSGITNLYGVPGTYSVRLTVSNAAGEIASMTRSNYLLSGVTNAYVSKTGSHVFPYTNWATAATNIQSAIDAGIDGSVVNITNGTYILPAQIVLDRGITVRGINGASATVIDGDGTGRCFYVNHGSAVVEGVTISGGKSTYGGGAYCLNGTVRNCVVRDNTATVDGGGIYIARNGTVRNCLVITNTAADDAGGIYLLGGGVVENCTIAANSAGDHGGGIECDSGGAVTNTILFFNDAGTSNDEFYNSGSGMRYSHCLARPLASADSVTNDPEFVSAGDYRLKPGSPCTDAGTNAAWMGSATDLAGKARIYNARVDVGCYELTPAALICNMISEQTSGFIPCQLVFTGYVAGTNVSGLWYFWDLENDGTNEISGPGMNVVTSQYDEAGTFTVRLTVSNAVGEVAYVVRSNYIETGVAVAYVSTNGGNIAPYTNWATAARSIQSAVNLGIEGSLVLVTNGRYALSGQISVGNGVTVRSVNGAGVTIVDGVNSNRCFSIEDSGTVVDGFTITRGRNGPGGGVYCDGGTLRNCTVVSNSTTGASSDGGGVYCISGGAVWNCVISWNSSADDGGGIQLGNSGVAGGTVANCLLYGNTAVDKGGGIYSWAGGSIRNCTVSDNSAYLGGGIATTDGGGSAANTISYFNTATTNNGNWAYVNVNLTYTNVCTTPSPSSSTITNDPQFVSRSQGDYRLLAGSPCIDAGTDAEWMAGASDLDGNARIHGDSADIGAFEFSYESFAPEPADGAVMLPISPLLSWQSGNNALSHNVYLGTNATEVTNATIASPTYIGDQTSTTNVPGGLLWNTVYYWRVDEVMSGTVVTGAVWSFQTLPSVPLIENSGATAPGMHSITLAGSLNSTGGAPAAVRVYWGTSDGGTTPANWQNAALFAATEQACPVSFVTNLTGLAGGSLYYYRFQAENSYGSSWASLSGMFRTVVDWTGWLHSARIGFPAYNKPETLTNFPLLVILNGSVSGFKYSQFSSTSGADLSFVDSREMILLNYEVEKWNTNGDSFVWVQVPAVSGTGAFITAYWGNSNAMAAAPSTTNGATWDAAYKGVWHLNSSADDATQNGNDGVNHGSTNAAGCIAGSHGFDGANDYIQLESTPMSTPPLGVSNFTLSVWFRRSGPGVPAYTGAGGTDAEPLITKGRGEADFDPRDMNYFLGISTSSITRLVADFEEGAGGTNPGQNHPVTGKTAPGNNVWNHAAVTYDGTWRLYLNSVLERTLFVGEPVRLDSIQPAAIGATLTSTEVPGGAFYGCMDEVRVECVPRSSNWVWACWMNQKPGSGFTAIDPVKNLDLDQDGLPDFWEVGFFGNTTLSAGLASEDFDSDGLSDPDEFSADTNPADAGSVLAVTGVDALIPGPGVRVDWCGGIAATQLVERATDLLPGACQWTAIHTAMPPTAVSTNIIDPGATNTAQFYRIRIAR